MKIGLRYDFAALNTSIIGPRNRTALAFAIRKYPHGVEDVVGHSE